MTVSSKNESPKTTQVDYAKCFEQRFDSCGIIAGANDTFQRRRCFWVYGPSITDDVIHASNKTV